MFEKPIHICKADIHDIITDDKDLEVMEESAQDIYLYDYKDDKELSVHFIEHMSADKLKDMIFISKDIPLEYQINKTLLAEYIWNNFDKNGLITLNELVVIWSEPYDEETCEPSDFEDEQQKRMADMYGDEYAYEIGLGYLGQFWNERNTVIINMGEIVRTSQEIAKENSDMEDSYFSEINQIVIGFLTTVLHELRHLQMDTNIFLPESEYPLNLASEEEVEEYCREVYEKSSYDVNMFTGLFKPSKHIKNIVNSAEQRKHIEPSLQNKEWHIER